MLTVMRAADFRQSGTHVAADMVFGKTLMLAPWPCWLVNSAG
jgi:hypothetical protein